MFNNFFLALSFRNLRFYLGILSVLFCCNTSVCSSQQTKRAHFSYQIWTTKDGLPQNAITALAQTSDGYIWLTTLEGLVRFDGVKFTVYDKLNSDVLKSNRMICMLKDSKGVLWIGTEGGGVYTFINNTEGEHFSNSLIPEHLKSALVTDICEDNAGTIWVAGIGIGVTKIAPQGFKHFTVADGLMTNNITCLASDEHGSIWLGTDKNGINILKGDTILSLTENEGLMGNSIEKIFRRRDNSIVISTRKGLSLLNNGVFKNYSMSNGLSSNNMWSIFEARDGRLLLGTSGGGLNIYDGTSFSHVTTVEGLSNNYIWSILEDTEGNIWLGMNGGGLNRLRQASFTAYGVEEGLSDNFVWCISESPKGGLWIGTYNGLNYFHNDVITKYSEADGLPAALVWTVLPEPNGDLWVGTMNGLCRFRNNVFKVYKTNNGLSNNHVQSLYRDKSGILWIGTYEGINLMIGDSISSFLQTDGFPTSMVMSILESKSGNIWLGTVKGLFRLTKKPNSQIVSECVFPELIVRSLYEDKSGNLWIGTQGAGLFISINGNFVSISRKNGLFDDVISQILEDNLGYFWFTSNKGVFKALKTDLVDFAEGKTQSIKCIAYGLDDGMKSQECNGSSQPAGCVSQDGRLWFPTIQGVVSVDPRSLSMNELIPPVQIEDVISDELNLSTAAPIMLPYDKSNMEIHYTALSYVAPFRVNFKYKLEGFNSNWQNVGNRRVAYYTNLPPGSYTFTVIACNNDDIWNEKGKSFSFTINPPFWKTWWFLSLIAILFGAILYGLYRYRLNRMLEIERTRTRIARDLHDEVSATLSGVVYFTQAVRNDAGNSVSANSNKFLSLIQESVGEVQDSMQDIIWSLNSENDDWIHILSKFRRYVSDACESRSITYDLKIPQSLPVEEPSMEQRKNFWLIYKEIVTNAVRHSNATLITVSLTSDTLGMIHLDIGDNGKGFNSKKSSDRNGLKNIRSRAKFLKASINLETEPGKGTLWSIKFHL